MISQHKHEHMSEDKDDKNEGHNIANCNNREYIENELVDKLQFGFRQREVFVIFNNFHVVHLYQLHMLWHVPGCQHSIMFCCHINDMIGDGAEAVRMEHALDIIAQLATANIEINDFYFQHGPRQPLQTIAKYPIFILDLKINVIYCFSQSLSIIFRCTGYIW